MDTSKIREHMKVVGSDRAHVGTIDHVEGDQIKLTRNDPQANGVHHLIPSNWIDRIEGDQVFLDRSAEQAHREWRNA